MKTRWHHLVTYIAIRSLPPPQPQWMSTPLFHFLVDCCLSPSLWPTTTIIVVVGILHLLASSSTPLLACVPPPSSPILCRGRVLFGVVIVAATVSVSILPPPHSVWLLCTDGRCRCSLLPCLPFDSSSSLTELPQPRLSTSHSHLPLPPRSHLFLPPKLTVIYFIVMCCSVVMLSPFPHPVVAIPPTVSTIFVVVRCCRCCHGRCLLHRCRHRNRRSCHHLPPPKLYVDANFAIKPPHNMPK